MDGFDESGLDPEIQAELAYDSTERLYVYTRATGGWFVVSPTGGFGLPFDFTQFVITASALYWGSWEQDEQKGLFGLKKKRELVQTAASMSVSDIDRVVVSRDGFDPYFADEVGVPREQHLALEVRGKGRSQTFYNWASNSADVMRDIGAIFAALGVAVEDRAGVLST